jgi:hypothetical protein
MRKDQIENIVRHLSPTSITLLRTLRQATCLEEWETRKTIQANRYDLLKLKNNKLTLTALGWRVAQLV